MPATNAVPPTLCPDGFHELFIRFAEMADDDVEHGVNQIAVDFIVFKEDAGIQDEVAFVIDVVFEGLILLVIGIEQLENGRFVVIVQNLRRYQDADHAVNAGIEDDDEGQAVAVDVGSRPEDDRLELVIFDFIDRKGLDFFFVEIFFKVFSFLVHWKTLLFQ